VTKPVDDAHAAGKQLEAFFLRQMLTEATPSGGGALDGGFAGDTFKQMLNEAIADKASQAGGIGLADLMAKQLTKQVGGKTVASQPTTAPATTHTGSQIAAAYRATPTTPTLAATASVPAGAPQLILPVAGKPTSGFGNRVDPVHGGTSSHPGFDLAAPTGTPVQAAAGGTVVHAGPAGTYGNLVIVRHDNGYETRYAHLSAVAVKAGDHVDAGTQVGNVGTTGYSTGPHLHFEVRHDGTPIDPAPLLPLNRSRVGTNR
jgi:murein DD-endopeptidase MepM/ murein hydrolase activator NlpD